MADDDTALLREVEQQQQQDYEEDIHFTADDEDDRSAEENVPHLEEGMLGVQGLAAAGESPPSTGHQFLPRHRQQRRGVVPTTAEQRPPPTEYSHENLFKHRRIERGNFVVMLCPPPSVCLARLSACCC